MSDTSPGRLQRADSHGLARFIGVDARRAVGGDEPTHFTPWLARNIDVLGSVLGLDLRVLDDPDDELRTGVHIEVAVGEYFLDILATDSSGRTVAIENQYGVGDHRHLGQLLTYASGVGADVLVWVAERFSDRHLETLRWLNERTDDECGVFAVRAQFVRIDNSAPAPVFELVAGPSQWARARRDVTKSQGSWTDDSFVKAVPEDEALVGELLDRVRTAPVVSGVRPPLWFGAKPNGAIFLRPGGTRYAPATMWANAKGRAMLSGAWTVWAPPVARHPAYRHIASFLGQDHTGRAAGVPLAGLDLDDLVAAMVRTAEELVELEHAEADEGEGPPDTEGTL